MHVSAPAFQLRHFPALELPLEGDDVRALAAEPVHAVREPVLLDNLAAELDNPGHEAAGLLQVLGQVHPEHPLTLKLTLLTLGDRPWHLCAHRLAVSPEDLDKLLDADVPLGDLDKLSRLSSEGVGVVEGPAARGLLTVLQANIGPNPLVIAPLSDEAEVEHVGHHAGPGLGVGVSCHVGQLYLGVV